MRKAVLVKLKKENYYNYAVSIFVNGKPIGTGAFFHKLYQALKFMDDCKVECYIIDFERSIKHEGDL